MKNTSFAVAALAAAGFSLAQPALGQSDDKLGIVNFETSCKPEAQKLFNQGMLYQHSFWYRASQKVFEDALKADSECGIAYWGIALSLLWNPHVPAPAKNLAEGAAVLEDRGGDSQVHFADLQLELLVHLVSLRWSPTRKSAAAERELRAV